LDSDIDIANFYRMNTEKEYRRARKKVKKKKGFYSHLTSYILVIGFLFILNMITSPLDIWFIFPALGWGLGLGFHYLGVFGLPMFKFNSEEWEEREIEKEIERSRGGGRRALFDAPSSSLEVVDELELKEFEKRYDERDFV